MMQQKLEQPTSNDNRTVSYEIDTQQFRRPLFDVEWYFNEREPLLA